ncbi:hypothetical protein MMC13_005482 [Lambiella insularis]|nr:hypothetical protein [Lambiella insularis]
MANLPLRSNLAFDLFDALGLPPITEHGRSTAITPGDVKKAWRKVSLHLHPDKRSQNLPYVPSFPTYEQARLATDWLLGEESVRLHDSKQQIKRALRHGRAAFYSTWNPDAKPGTDAVLKPMPGFAVHDGGPVHARKAAQAAEAQREKRSPETLLANLLAEPYHVEQPRPDSPSRRSASDGMPYLTRAHLQQYTGPLSIIVGDTLRQVDCKSHRYAVQASVVRGVLYLHRLEAMDVKGNPLPLAPEERGCYPAIPFEHVRLVGFPFVDCVNDQHKLRTAVVKVLSEKITGYGWL